MIISRELMQYLNLLRLMYIARVIDMHEYHDRRMAICRSYMADW